jgi:hypothetical protein
MECNLVFVVKFSGLIHPGGLIANFLSKMMNVSELSQERVVARRCCVSAPSAIMFPFSARSS